MDTPLTDPTKGSLPLAQSWSLRRFLIAGSLIVLVVAGFAVGYVARTKTTAELDAAATLLKNSLPLVNSARVKRAPFKSEVLLPGNITPITEAYVFARAAGYL